MTYGEDGDPDKSATARGGNMGLDAKRPSGEPTWRPPWERAGGMVVSPDAMLLDEPAVVSPSLTLTGDTDEEDGEEVWA